jgi:hypothetical protein
MDTDRAHPSRADVPRAEAQPQDLAHRRRHAGDCPGPPARASPVQPGRRGVLAVSTCATRDADRCADMLVDGERPRPSRMPPPPSTTICYASRQLVAVRTSLPRLKTEDGARALVGLPIDVWTQQRSARAVTAGLAFVQNLRRGHCEIAIEQRANLRLAAAFSELALCPRPNSWRGAPKTRTNTQRNARRSRPRPPLLLIRSGCVCEVRAEC